MARDVFSRPAFSFSCTKVVKAFGLHGSCTFRTHGVLLKYNFHGEINLISFREELRGISLYTPVTFTSSDLSIFISLPIGSSLPNIVFAAVSESIIELGSDNPF